MDRAFEKLIEVAKAELVKNSHGMRAANKLVHVSGARHKLPLEDREVEIVYYPAPESDNQEKQPLIIGYHGGGFVVGGCALDDAMWVAVTKALHVNVASVGYRMSPEFQWKETLADSYDSAVYLKEHANEFGFDGDHLSVMGQSAGGNLAAAVSLLANQNHSVRFDNIVLVYPFLDVHTDPNEKGPGSLVGPQCYAMNQLHCDYEDTLNPLVSPIYATPEMLEGLPNTFINYCENDNLRHEALKYAKMLTDAGVPVHTCLSPGMPHGYFESGFKEPTEFEINFLLGEDGPKIIADGSLARCAQETLEFIRQNFVK